MTVAKKKKVTRYLMFFFYISEQHHFEGKKTESKYNIQFEGKKKKNMKA